MKKLSKKAFCVMPWMNLATETNGKCKICCVVMSDKYIKNEKNEDFLIYKDNIETIWNSEYLASVRKKMLNEEWPDDCFYCKKQEESQVKSPRQDYNERWASRFEEVGKLNYSEDGTCDRLPISLEPRPGILCDLKCHSCWSMSSSKILAERTQIIEKAGDFEAAEQKQIVSSWEYEVKSANVSDFNWAENETYIENIKKCSPTLKRLYFTGGEPTLIKSNQKILKHLAEQNKNDTLVAFTTNLNFKSRKFFEDIKSFDVVEITGSLDSVGEKNSYVRYPSDWTRVLDNTKYLIQIPNVHFSFMTLIQAMNVVSLVDIFEWVAETPELRERFVILTYIQDPAFLTLKVVPDKIRKNSVKKIDKLLGNQNVNKHNRSQLEQYKAYLLTQEPYSEELNIKFKNYIAMIDAHRGTRFKKTFPELENI